MVTTTNNKLMAKNWEIKIVTSAPSSYFALYFAHIIQMYFRCFQSEETACAKA